MSDRSGPGGGTAGRPSVRWLAVPAISTADAHQLPIPPTSKTFARAIEDIRGGLRERELWSHLGWQDIKQRYRRSGLGPLWVTIRQGGPALGVGRLSSPPVPLHLGAVL